MLSAFFIYNAILILSTFFVYYAGRCRYKFDKNISGVIFPVILRIESEIKTILSISTKKELCAL